MNAGLSPGNLKKAIGYFDEALRLDPDDPLALDGKASAQIVGLSAFRIGDWRAVGRNAQESADRILVAHPNDVWAHFIRGSF